MTNDSEERRPIGVMVERVRDRDLVSLCDLVRLIAQLRDEPKNPSTELLFDWLGTGPKAVPLYLMRPRDFPVLLGAEPRRIDDAWPEMRAERDVALDGLRLWALYRHDSYCNETGLKASVRFQSLGVEKAVAARRFVELPPQNDSAQILGLDEAPPPRDGARQVRQAVAIAACSPPADFVLGRPWTEAHRLAFIDAYDALIASGVGKDAALAELAAKGWANSSATLVKRITEGNEARARAGKKGRAPSAA